MKFLDYGGIQLLGRPSYEGADYCVWVCPCHIDNHPSFRSLPPLEGCKDRFRCNSCGFRGDLHDLMRLVYDKTDYAAELKQIAKWKKEFERLHGQPQANSKPNIFSSRGRGIPKVKAEKPDLDSAWAMFQEILRDDETSECFALQILKDVKKCCELHAVSIENLVNYFDEFEKWMLDTDLKHLDECGNENCDAAVCRISCGLMPISLEQIEAEKKSKREVLQRRKIRIKRAMRGVVLGRKPKRKSASSDAKYPGLPK